MLQKRTQHQKDSLCDFIHSRLKSVYGAWVIINCPSHNWHILPKTRVLYFIALMLTGMRVHPESARPFNKIEREAVFKLSDSCKYVIFRFCRASVFLLSLLLLLLFWGVPISP